VYFIRGIILELFVAFLLMTIMEPLVVFLEKIKIPRVVSVLITYILVIGVLGGSIALIIPTLVQQTTNFANALPTYFANIGIQLSISGDVAKGFMQQISGVSGEVLNFTFSLFSNVFAILTILVFAFYMLLTHNGFKSQVQMLFGEAKGQKISKLIIGIEEKLGKWARGQLILMLAVAIGTYIGLLLISVPFALPLAILAGIFEIIPILGPIVSTIPAALIGFGISPVTGVGVVVVALLVRGLEGYVLVPKVMQKSVGVSPLVVLISIAVGAKLAGIMGVIVSIPLVITFEVLIREYFIKE
jgi:predicted PurR-regulated permease PerM